MIRIPEKSLMTEDDQVEAWNSAHRKFTIDGFVEWFKFRKNKTGLILDIGCGTAQLGLALLNEFKDIKIKGYDGSPTMVNRARKNIEDKGVTECIDIECCMIEDIPQVPDCTTIISLGVLHHFDDPMVFWKSLDRISPEGSVWMILDIVRPKDENELSTIIDEVKSMNHTNELYLADLENSLRSAFTVDEIRSQLSELGLNFGIEEHFNPIAGEILMIQVKK